ncbi:MAG: hypothetical protein LC107_07080 [Chitinophagales bacterium]|nr:hypothetical protein [Chitinophagales bacterium]
MIAGYYKLVALTDEVKAQNKIKSKARLDCISFAGTYKGLTNFVNKQGQLFFYKTPCREFVEAQSKRTAEWSLTNSSLNFSSIYIEDFDFLEYGYGYPNAKPRLSNGEPNPLHPFKNDGYLFITNKDYTQIEVLIISDGRNLISHYYQHLIDGYFDGEIQRLRADAKPFYEYIGFENANSKL